jgi:hypothetical protein
VNSPPKLPYIHRIYMVLANPTYVASPYVCIRATTNSPNVRIHAIHSQMFPLHMYAYKPWQTPQMYVYRPYTPHMYVYTPYTPHMCVCMPIGTPLKHHRPCLNCMLIPTAFSALRLILAAIIFLPQPSLGLLSLLIRVGQNHIYTVYIR